MSLWLNDSLKALSKLYAAERSHISYAYRLGAMAETVEDGFTGLHFEPGNARDLADKVQWAHEHANEMAHMGRNARTVYEAEYTPEKNYPILLAIYEKAFENNKLRYIL